ncbi:hypothetical protein Droror1_Dr00020984 [Drosera rotundifolia]
MIQKKKKKTRCFWIINFFFRYHIPRSFLSATGNLLVIFEEEKKDPRSISIDLVSVTKVCAHVSDTHLPPVVLWNQTSRSNKKHGHKRPKVQLQCPPRSRITKVLFASYRNPSGDCQSYAIGSCHSSNSKSIIEKVSFQRYFSETQFPLSYAT